ncbi:MAG: DEAD/DEAH box helicase [Bacteroides sp.]|nr:DEAD/DEAH box helicase [Bacteroides sp.]
MRFDEILENDDVLDALWDMHFDECTPIQEQAIPAVLDGRDLLACAQTGTGKTAAYLLPVIDLLSDGGYPKDAVNCVVMAPTRELAQQIDQQLQGFSYFLPISSMPIYGGTDGHTYEQQRKGLKSGADIVVATPGRLLAHLAMGYVDLSQVSFFILDEADRMLDMGFLDDIMQIVARLPKNRQTLLFSATMPKEIQKFADAILTDPFEIKLAVSKPAEKIRQSAFVCYETQKLPIVSHLFSQQAPEKVIIFSSSKLKVKELARAIAKLKVKVGEMHSDLDQTAREKVMLDFKSGRVNVLVATDIVARGIDIDDIELVINYDVPHEAEDYVHRVGRTARADRDGRAITFVNEKEIRKFMQIEKFLEKEVEKEPIPEYIGEGPAYRGGSRNGGGRNGNRSGGTRQSGGGYGRYNKKRGRGGRNSFANNSGSPEKSENSEKKVFVHKHNSGKKSASEKRTDSVKKRQSVQKPTLENRNS